MEALLLECLEQFDGGYDGFLLRSSSLYGVHLELPHKPPSSIHAIMRDKQIHNHLTHILEVLP